MTTYRAATGHDVVLGSLTVLDPAPDPGEGIQYAAVRYAADGTVYHEGAYFEFAWSEMSAADYATMLSNFGLDSAAYANVTIYVRDEVYGSWVRKNGVAQRPIPGGGVRWNIRPRDIVIRVTGLVTSS